MNANDIYGDSSNENNVQLLQRYELIEEYEDKRYKICEN